MITDTLKLSLEQAKEHEKVVLKEDTEAIPTRRKHVLNKEEREKLDILIRKYEYDYDEVVELENGETKIIAYSGSKSIEEIDLGARNSNAERVKAIEVQKRTDAKEKHAKEVERNKELLKKQLLQKEKKTKANKTQKQEKRRM